MSTRSDHSCRVAIIGAGPQGLAAAMYLARRGVAATDLTVIDPSGTWLAEWGRMFVHLGIAHLRSPSVHHPHPDPYALGRFARAAGRTGELLHTYGLPTTALFDDFCRSAIGASGLADVVRRDTVTAIEPHGRLTLAGGAVIHAEHVVHAANPSFVERPDQVRSMEHVHDWWEIPAVQPGQRVAIIGGGLTAAHLVDRALDAGAHVEWLTRRPVTERDFDTDPGWLGPKHMAAFEAEPDMTARLATVLAARGGGTVPSWMATHLGVAERSGRLCRRVGAIGVDRSRPATRLTVGDAVVGCDVIWLATGSRPTVEASPVLADLCSEAGTEVVGGRPVVDDRLRVPGTVVQVLGRLAQLRLGPTAGNLAGARRGAELVVGEVLGLDAMFELRMG